jgi:REP element-mobilizing transposase RayT
MSQSPYRLEAEARAAVLESVKEVCAFRGWRLLAAHVRTNHVHVVLDVASDVVRPEKVMNDFKAYSSRLLTDVDGPRRKRWARHGSTGWLAKDQDVRKAIRYVVEGQGEPMAVYCADLM